MKSNAKQLRDFVSSYSQVPAHARRKLVSKIDELFPAEKLSSSKWRDLKLKGRKSNGQG